ncbi:hypothetical protein PG993_002477 [Apiospora rasikravindrae]|uniref:PLD phosphodiesterase domain-containing protein n=1 Tax=Apiospora rasikravindrae TaxID=990691 RepID=A0ABR1TWU1_9PEZI
MTSPTEDNNTGYPKLGSTLYQAFVEFPVSAFTIPRQQDIDYSAMHSTNGNTTATTTTLAHHKAAEGVSDYKIVPELVQLCQEPESVSSRLAKQPDLAPGTAWKHLYSRHERQLSKARDIRDIGKGSLADGELEKARQCGKWGPTEPSDLFLRLYHDALCTLNEDLGSGMVSPSLMGSSGVVPLTIISCIPDIVRHMSNLIVRAEKEVYLATNYWQNGVASSYLTDAIKELSRRCGERGTKAVVKVVYDRGSARQVFQPHQVVAEKDYTGKAVGLPAPGEIPNVDLQAMNYHDPLLGTFHAKYMIVDRKIAVLQSNNIQDNDNLEMMVQVEGPIVDSLYDMALLTWHKAFEPPLPSHNTPVATNADGRQSFDINHGDLFTSQGTLHGSQVVVLPEKMIPRAAPYGIGADQALICDGSGSSGAGSTLQTSNGDTPLAQNGVTNGTANGTTNGTNGTTGQTETNGNGNLEQSSQSVPAGQTIGPVQTGEPLPEHLADDPHYDADLAGEIARVQASIAGGPGESHMEAVGRHLNHTINKGFRGAMTPYMPHPAHAPFPVALVNRDPYGPPNHKSVANPQNAVWLSALRNASRNVFIQSPTLNAEPLVPAIVEACERGIDVYCYICLGYNDVGELLPMQGGHNEMIANKLFEALSPTGKERLHWYWYVGKDQSRPVAATAKKRSCHIKLMIVDERVGIAGSGNQDTQSWFHSQEVNAMIDSAEVCRGWIDALRRNQNTHRYGQVGREDGVWRDGEGSEVRGSMGVDPGRFSWARGLVGAVKRVQGEGGF